MQVGPTAALLPERTVTFNKISVFFSCCFLLNLASMPLKAYLTEPFPWLPLEAPLIGVSPNANETFAAFERRALDHYTTRYTATSRMEALGYFYDAANDVDVLCAPLSRTTEASFSYVNLPGAFFYAQRTRLWIRDASLGKRNASTIALVQLGTLFGVPSFVAAIWIDSYDNLFFAAHLTRGSTAWLYWKFGFRIATTLRIVYLLWTTYYAHYRSLVRGLRCYGTCGESERLEIIVGDPTCLILQNTWICVFFVVDFWCSPELATQSFVRINQTADMWAFAISTLYLSRTVWFGYLVLNLSGFVLRRCALETRCAQADPTGVAIGVALAVGPLTYFQLRLAFFIDLYHALFTFVLSKSESSYTMEAAIPAMLYTILLGILPLVYSFGIPALQHVVGRVCRRVWVQRTVLMAKSSRRRLSRVISRSLLMPRAIDGGSFGRLNYNDWKHRLLLSLIFGCCCCRRKRRLPKAFKGGSIYKLFTTHRHLQRNAAFSFRGSDCYVLSHASRTIISYRLSLSDALYLKHRPDVVLGACPGAAFGHLVASASGTIGVHFGAEKSRWLL